MIHPLSQAAITELSCKKPLITPGNYEVTSPSNGKYNCFAWAAEVTNTHWNPYLGWWPDYAPKDCAVETFELVYGKELGYTSCESGEWIPGIQKLALYVSGGEVKHLARQLEGGKWASKLGVCQDIVHDTEFDLEGNGYGTVQGYLMREKTTPDPQFSLDDTWRQPFCDG